MKLIIAIVRSSQMQYIIESLRNIGIDSMTITEVKGSGRQKGASDLYGDVEYQALFVPKMRIEIVAPDEKAA
jgi:nitrogen regulatory protein P-II 1